MIVIKGIALKGAKKAPMTEFSSIDITEAGGLMGDIRGGGGLGRNRQVTLLSEEQWDKASASVGMYLPWHARRANILITGYSFGPTDVGKQLRMGTGVVLEITCEVEPCARMDEACSGLRKALTPEWRGGVACRVIRGGMIRLSNVVAFAVEKVHPH